MKIFKLNIVIVIILNVLFGCASKDEESPVITSVKVEDNVVTIEANDNVGVTSYISVGNPSQPSLTDEKWQESNTITLTDDGSYYIWVKDASDNLNQYTETIEMRYNLAQKFDHLNWLTPAEGTRVVDGVTYNLAELKAEYGDLYRFAEPLTEEEIESRFEYIAKFYELQRVKKNASNNYNWYREGALKANPIFDKYITDFQQNFFKNMTISNDLLIKRFNQYFGFSTAINSYSYLLPDCFDSTLGMSGVGTDTILKATLFEKEYYVRFFTITYENHLSNYEKENLKPEYVFESWEWN